MTLSAIWQLCGGHAVFCMLLCDLIGLVFVTAIAGVFDIRGSMAGSASDLPAFSVIERKGMDLQKSWRPDRIAMTLLAFLTEEADVNSRLGMALDATRGNALVEAVLMTFQAGELSVRTFQWKNDLVVEISHPVPSVMTFQASLTILRNVLLHETGIPFTMTGNACAGID
jgi:hypothetical protein